MCADEVGEMPETSESFNTEFTESFFLSSFSVDSVISVVNLTILSIPSYVR
jgi:hypothetical protein